MLCRILGDPGCVLYVTFTSALGPSARISDAYGRKATETYADVVVLVFHARAESGMGHNIVIVELRRLLAGRSDISSTAAL